MGVSSLEKLEELLEDIRERLERLEEKLKPEPTCLTYPQAAARLGVGLTKLKRMAKTGELRVAKIGRVPMVPLSEIQRVSTPPQERPKLERAQRSAKWVPLR